MQPYSLIVIPFFLAKQLEYMEKGGHKGTPQRHAPTARPNGTAQRSASTFSPYGIFKFSNCRIFKYCLSKAVERSRNVKFSYLCSIKSHEDEKDPLWYKQLRNNKN